MGMVQHHPAMNPPATPICSVCIANYNGAGLLPDCLDSILAQQGGFSYRTADGMIVFSISTWRS